MQVLFSITSLQPDVRLHGNYLLLVDVDQQHSNDGHDASHC